MAAGKRNYGIDLLRMLSMFMIVNLHVLGQGGVMVRSAGSESVYYACWFIETCAYCAVDCYGLISGYVGVDGKHRMARILELWLQVFFYSAGITLLYWIFAPELLAADSLWKAIFPVCRKSYWYFSAYVGLFFVIPYLNRMINSMREQELKRMAWTLFLVFSVGTAVPKVIGTDVFSLGGGYSFVWLLILYLLGGCLKRCRFVRWKPWKYAVAYFGLSAFSWLFKIVVENYTREHFGEAMYGRVFTGYAAPTMLLCAVCLVLLFEQLKLNGKRIQQLIALLSPAAFSVYLIHTQPMVWENLMKRAFTDYRSLSAPLVMAAVLATALAIYLVCSLIDLVRIRLFRLWKVREGTEWAVQKVETLVSGSRAGTGKNI